MSEAMPQSGRLLRWVTLAFACTAALLIGVTTWVIVRPPTVPSFAPLGDYPVQSITTSSPIPVGADVGVTGTKCSNATGPVPVTGRTSWMSVDPRGTAFMSGEGSGIRLPGCHTLHFENPMPTQVQDRVRRMATQGKHLSAWVIFGVEVPIAPNGERPVKKAYTSERFEIAG